MSPLVSDQRRRTRRAAGGRGTEGERPTHALERLERLHEISCLLTAFDSVEKTFPDVVTLVARALPLRSAVLVMKGQTVTATTAWAPAGMPAATEAVTERAEAAFAYLTAAVEAKPRMPGLATAREGFVALPLVVDTRQTFGVLQLEGEVRDEMDLWFTNSVANQLAVALLRNDAEAERESLLVAERQARTQAEAENRAKDEFLAILSHELRTPLNAIAGWAQLLNDAQLNEAERAKAVETICRNAAIQKQLISDILDVHSIVAGRLRLECSPLDLGAVVESARDTLKPAADARRIEVRLTPAASLGTVVGDASRLQQVVWNLLSNAIKFTPDGGRIEIALRSDAPRQVSLVISDSGPGIPAAFLPHVFEAFRQADSTPSRRHGGLGLGLAIAHKIVGLHDGAITAANAAGGGAVFTVTLPTAAGTIPVSSERDRTGPDPETPSLVGVRVLVVDDVTDDREVLARLLEQEGAIVVTAASAAEGLATLERERPQVLLSDISMPGEDGYAFLRRVRALPVHCGGMTPAAAVTAFASAEDRRHSLAAGFHAHLSKPVDVRTMARLVAALAARAPPPRGRR